MLPHLENQEAEVRSYSYISLRYNNGYYVGWALSNKPKNKKFENVQKPGKNTAACGLRAKSKS